MGKFFRKMTVAVAALMMVLFFGCGGGGGGGSHSAADNDSDGDMIIDGPYKGKGTAVMINSGNPVEVVETAFNQISSASGLGVMSLQEAGDLGEGQKLSLRDLMIDANIFMLDNLFEPQDDFEEKSLAGYSAVTPINVVIYGDCGGSVTYTGDISGSGDFIGKYIYDNYCISGIVMDGDIFFEGTKNGNNTDLDETYDLKIFFGNEEYSWSGRSRVTTTTTAYSIEYTLNYYSVYSIGRNASLWMDNFAVKMIYNLNTGLFTYSMSGRIYNSLYGYVDIITNADYNSMFTSGEIVFKGANNTKARLMFFDDGTSHIDVDADGNGSYEQVVANFSAGYW